MDPSSPTAAAEELLLHGVSWLRLGVESVGVAIIAVGIAVAVVQLLKRKRRFNGIRLTLASYLTLSLEFLLAADLLGTAVSPSWDQLGKLAVIAVIRTGLSFFLAKEMEHERRAEAREEGN